MGYVACLGQIPEETAHVLQNLVSANGLRQYFTHSTTEHKLNKMSTMPSIFVTHHIQFNFLLRFVHSLLC